MKARTLTNILLVVLLVLLGGILYELLAPNNSTLNLNTGAPLNSTSTATSVSNANVSITAKQVNESDQNSDYQITASYPVISGLSNATVQNQINQDISTVVNTDIESFKSSDSNGVAASSTSSGGGDQSTLTINYTVTKSTHFPNTIGFLIDEEFYSSGAAHPGAEYVSLNYDLTTGHRIGLSDLFKPDSQYLQVMSAYSITTLTSKMGSDADASAIQQGAAPSADNFKVFLITDKGLDVTFNEYQVAGYAAGSQDVVIPWQSLAQVVDPTGPLGSEASTTVTSQ